MIKLIQNFPSIVGDQDIYSFTTAKDGLYAITIVARCKNWYQNFRRRFNDDDLGVKIDDFLFCELKGKKREFVGAGTWNGNELKNKRKGVLYILPIKSGTHKITFFSDIAPLIESIDVASLDIKALNYNLLVPKDVQALDLVFKNVKVDDLEIKNKKKETTILALQDAVSGALYLHVQKLSDPAIDSIQAKIIPGPFKFGWVKLYSDIVTQTTVNMRALPNMSADILVELSDGDVVEILNERVIGEMFIYHSNIWHQISYRGIIGYINSAFIEIQGQDRDRIIDIIKAKCAEKNVNVDANIMLAIAGVESRYKPFAVGFTKEELALYRQNGNADTKDLLGARGVFQLRSATAMQESVKDRFDFYDNVRGGVLYYKWIMENVIKRGNVDKKRLIAWHDGLGNVPAKYDYEKLSVEMKSFIKSVLANIEKRDWKKIISISVILLAIIFAWQRVMFINKTDIHSPPDLVVVETVKASNSPTSVVETIKHGNDLIFEDNNNVINKISVRAVYAKDGRPITKLTYQSKSGVIRNEVLLEGWLLKAGWHRDLFYVAREAGVHSMPVAFYAQKNGHLVRVKFFEKNGHIRDEIEAPIFLADATSITVEERQSQFADIPRNLLIEVSKDYRYYRTDNAFHEFSVLRQETDMGSG